MLTLFNCDFSPKRVFLDLSHFHILFLYKFSYCIKVLMALLNIHYRYLTSLQPNFDFITERNEDGIGEKRVEIYIVNSRNILFEHSWNVYVFDICV